MVVTKQEENIQANRKIENETHEQVDSFNKHLSQTITPYGRKYKWNKNPNCHCQKQISTNVPSYHFKENMQIWHRLLVCYIFSVILHGCKTWILTKSLMDKIKACEIWFLRLMRKVSWKENIIQLIYNWPLRRPIPLPATFVLNHLSLLELSTGGWQAWVGLLLISRRRR